MHRPGVAKPAGHPALHRFLEQPRMTVDTVGLCAFFRVTRVTFTFARPPDLDDGWRLTAALRGALGRQLLRLAQMRGTDGGAQLWHALFADYRWTGRERHYPKPFVIWITPRPKHLYVEVSLFGEVGHWRDDLIEALTRVMLPRERGGEGGVSLDAHTRARRIWPIRDVYWRVRDGIVPPPPRRSFVLSTLTPLVAGSNRTLRGTYRDMFASLLYRLAGLARWHGIDVPLLNGPETVLPWCGCIRVEPVGGIKAARYERRSRSFGVYKRPENGILGHFLVRDYPEQLWPCFVLAPLVNMGYSIPQGAGRVVLSDP